MKAPLPLVLLLLFACANAFAASGRLGLAVGVSYNEYTLSGSKAHGVGGAGAAVYSLFPESPIGLRASLVGNFLSSSGTGVKVSGFAPLAALTANYNYKAAGSPGRVSIGAGVGYDRQSGLTCTGSNCPSFPSSTTGLVLEAKADGGGRVFGLLQAFFPMDDARTKLKMIQGILVGGYEFGGGGK